MYLYYYEIKPIHSCILKTNETLLVIVKKDKFNVFKGCMYYMC